MHDAISASNSNASSAVTLTLCKKASNPPTMLTYPWKCTVLHCNHLGNTWVSMVVTGFFVLWRKTDTGQEVQHSVKAVCLVIEISHLRLSTVVSLGTRTHLPPMRVPLKTSFTFRRICNTECNTACCKHFKKLSKLTKIYYKLSQRQKIH